MPEFSFRSRHHGRVAILVSRYNEVITTRLLDGALAGCDEAGIPRDEVDVVWLPGAFELTSERGAHSLAATVDIIEPMGAETLLHLVADGRQMRAVVNRRVRLAAGAQVHVRLRPSQVHIFDATGVRIPAESAPRAGAA